MKPNQSRIIDRNRKAIAGVQQHFAHAKAILLDGVPHKPADVVKILQDQIDAIDKTNAAKLAFHQTVAAQKAASATANAVFLALKARVFSDFKASAETLGEFGLAPPQRRKPKPKTLVEAAAKRAKTRTARGTAGATEPSPPTTGHS